MTLYAALSLLFGIGAIPVGVLASSYPVGVAVALAGAIFGIAGLLVAIWNRAAGVMTSFTGLLACFASALVAVALAGGPTAVRQSFLGDLPPTGPTAGPTKVPGDGGMPAKRPPPEPDPTIPPRPPVVAAGHSDAIRLSGIHRPPPGGFNLLTIQDRSDLDLWIDNPVEADAKWKGKVVEVEMRAGELHIVKQDDLAVLVTPTEDPWGIMGGWQIAGFLFRGASQKQLIGFQNREGEVLIRGECKGLYRGRVAFDNCEILRLPPFRKQTDENDLIEKLRPEDYQWPKPTKSSPDPDR